ncbi:MAG: AlpA family phage regulatory protein [Rhodospirillales bacterium]|nr:AlpA family phage regulatory protein [Rhodospirillales bacterium]
MSTAAELRLLPIREVTSKIGCSRAHVYRLMHAAGFPRPVHLSKRARAWRSDEVDAWIEARSAERVTPPPR